MWSLNLENNVFFVADPEYQRFGEVYTTRFAKNTVLLTCIYSVFHLWLRYQIERKEAILKEIEHVHQIYVTPFVIATFWLWLGLLDGLMIYAPPFFFLAWPMVLWSVSWSGWSFWHLLRRYLRIRRSIMSTDLRDVTQKPDGK